MSLRGIDQPFQAASPAQAARHYENFPVASWLCPKHLRAPIAAIYWFARTADDLADEGDAQAGDRLAQLAAYRLDLNAALMGQNPSTRWEQVFGPLAIQAHACALPARLLHDLLDAFEEDVRRTATRQRYAESAARLAYCARSANPVGRLLLHLWGVADELSLTQSDAICTALQLINFWQDLSQDIPRGRHYLCTDELAAHGLTHGDVEHQVQACHQTQNATKLIAALAQSTAQNMKKAQNLPLRISGRAGWELRLVVQGGLRLLDKIAACGHQTLVQRVKLGKWDAVVMFWRAIWM